MSIHAAIMLDVAPPARLARSYAPHPIVTSTTGRRSSIEINMPCGNDEETADSVEFAFPFVGGACLWENAIGTVLRHVLDGGASPLCIRHFSAGKRLSCSRPLRTLLGETSRASGIVGVNRIVPPRAT